MSEDDLLAEAELGAGRRHHANAVAAPHPDERKQRQQRVVQRRPGA
jgi:hypothetical protein